MAIRCKLISPTNLLLEHPMLSPVKETEFVVMGVREWHKNKIDYMYAGGLAGAVIMACIAACIFSLYLGRGFLAQAAKHFWPGEVHAQIVATQPVVSGCNPTGNVTVCTMTDAATQRSWLIVYTSSGISVVEDDLRR